MTLRQQPRVWAILWPCFFALSLAASQWHSTPSSPTPGEKADPALSLGKKLFVERCGRCHDERGDKALAEGPPLAERKLSPDVIARASGGRLRSYSEEERRAVALYIESFLKK